jgi:porphobilinogen synthase
MIREVKLSVDDLIMPYFVVHGKGIRCEIPSIPGNFHLSVDELVKEVEEVRWLNIPAVLLFGIPKAKDEEGTCAYSEDGIIQQAVRAIKEKVQDIIVITDVCLCEYTTHGHCGVIEDGKVVNDPTLDLLSKIALSHVKAGSDMVAPSDMMDGRVGDIRKALDENGYKDIPIMSYAVKYASAFYSPFREAASSTPAFGDRRSYQMDIANTDEALREVRLDIEEGADIIMVKPALAYLDVIYRIKNQFGYPVAAYNVSGEFAMIKSAASSGLIDEKKTVLEVLTSIKRAGADIIITYFAKDTAKWLKLQ